MMRVFKLFARHHRVYRVPASRPKLAGLSGRVLLGAMVFLSPVAKAQEYPTRPIRIIVPYAAGISADVVARILADKLCIAWKQPVIVDNRPGASGMIGAEAAARSPADGHTLLMGVTAIMAMNPHLYRSIRYDPFRDFKPVSYVLNVPFVLVAAPDRSYHSLDQLTAAAKKSPGKIDFASLGEGSHAHVAMVWFTRQAGLELLHVPYKASPSADLMGGVVSLYMDPLVTALPLIQGGKVQAIAISTKGRSPVLPNTPSIAETIPGFDTYAFQGIFAPAGTPDTIARKLGDELARIVRMPDVKKKLMDFGYVPVGGGPEELAEVLRGEYKRYQRIIRENNIRLE